jgi:hypothetical protein
MLNMIAGFGMTILAGILLVYTFWKMKPNNMKDS